MPLVSTAAGPILRQSSGLAPATVGGCGAVGIDRLVIRGTSFTQKDPWLSASFGE